VRHAIEKPCVCIHGIRFRCHKERGNSKREERMGGTRRDVCVRERERCDMQVR